MGEIINPKQNKISEIVNGLMKEGGDHAEQYVTRQGKETVTKVDTHEVNFTHRQYKKQDGSDGKQTLTFKELNQ